MATSVVLLRVLWIKKKCANVCLRIRTYFVDQTCAKVQTNLGMSASDLSEAYGR